MAIADDFSVAVNGDIRHVSGSTTYTVLQFHRFLQDLADDAQASGNDLLDITSSTPSDRSTDNIISLNSPYNIDDTVAEYLYDGSITQTGGNTVYSGLRVLGAVNTAATQLFIIQDNGLYQFTTTPSAPFWGTQGSGGYNGDAAQGILMRCLVKSRDNGADIDGQRIRVQARHYGDTYDFFNVTLGQGESVAAISTTPDAQNDTAQGTVTAYSDVLNSGGTANAPTGGYQTIDLNNGNGARPYYSKWTYGSQADGLKAIWEYTKDLTGMSPSLSAKTTDSLDGGLFLGITHDLNYDNESGGPFSERETVVWGTKIFYDTLVSGPFTAGNYVTIGSGGAAGRVMYDNAVGGYLIIALEDTSITVLNNDVITEYAGPGASASSTTAVVDTGGGAVEDNDKSGGSGLLLALNDLGATGDMWLQLLTGSAPLDNLPLIGVTSEASADVNGSAVSRTVPKIFTGAFTGSYIGAFGIGIDVDDLSATDTLEDLLAVTQTPPNNVTFAVTGLVSGEDRVLVGPRSAGTLNKAQDTLSGTLTDNVTTAVGTTSSIPVDTPAVGTVRIEDDNGVYTRQAYASYTGSTFTLSAAYQGSDNADANSGNDLFISYIDELSSGTTASFTTIYSSNRDLFVRVRDGGASPIKTFEIGATLTATGGTVAAIRTSDA